MSELQLCAVFSGRGTIPLDMLVISPKFIFGDLIGAVKNFVSAFEARALFGRLFEMSWDSFCAISGVSFS